jgi:diguanylate cyclase (GGDEF)-like protein
VQIDPTSLIVVNVANLLVMATALPFVMGQGLSPAAKDARISLFLNAAAWICMLASSLWYGQTPDRILSTVAMALISLSQWMIYRALESWLGPRPLRGLLWLLVWIMPVGYGLSFSSYAVRVGWANLLLAAQMLIVARACLYPASRDFGRRSWRYPLAGCLVVMAGFTAARGVLGAWFTELYPFFRAPTPVNIAALIGANMSLVLGTIAILAAWREEAERQLHKLATTDGLTGLFNRHGWTVQTRRPLRQAQRHGHPLSLLMLDVDHFKRINDTHGHEAGDAALQLIGQLLQRCQRAGDVGARVGGEEFCVLLPYTDAAAAQAFDARLRAELAASAATAGLPFALDFSSGHALYRAAGETIESLMARADAALYRAKNSGRGRLVLYDSTIS